MKQLKSFGYALRGIGTAVCTEAHLRFHLVAAVYVLVFACFYHFSPAQTAILYMLIGLVIAAELINTALENICDLVTREQHPLIRAAKDMAAGAVLAISVAAAAVACVFFLDFKVIGEIFTYFAAHPLSLAGLAVSAATAVIFVWKGPSGIKRLLTKNK
ncbi:MAG: diacylglycerol kinase family protein [Ruminococcus sp.]|nr:diacylglycerol kinase family protein [Ruminococcus sp.]